MLSRSHLQIQTTGVVLIDILCLVAGSVLGVMFGVGPEEMPHYVTNHLDGWLIFVGSIVLANYLAGSYRVHYRFSRFNVVVTWLFSLTFALLVLSITSLAWFRLLLGRGVLVLAVGIYSLLSLPAKMLVYEHVFRTAVFTCRAVVVGCGRWAEWARITLESRWILPRHQVVAYLVPEVDPGAHPEEWRDFHDGVAVVHATPDHIGDVVRSLGSDLVVLAVDRPEERRLYGILRRLRFTGVEVLSRLAVAEVYTGRTPLELIDENDVFQASLESRVPVVFRLKRVSDVLVSLLALLLFVPVIFLVALAIKVSAPRSPVLYIQTRSGQFGRLFRIIKFRTMRTDAEAGTGPVWSVADDPRITRLGRWLRRFRLDELPQLINVLRGEMSLVGPRPERPELVTELEAKIPFYAERSNLVPGLSGWAQIQYPYGNTVDDAARKLEYDLYYMKYMNLSLDLQIILRTLRIVLLGVERDEIDHPVPG